MKKKKWLYLVLGLNLVCLIMYTQIRTEMDNDAQILYEKNESQLEHFNNQINDMYR